MAPRPERIRRYNIAKAASCGDNKSDMDNRFAVYICAKDVTENETDILDRYVNILGVTSERDGLNVSLRKLRPDVIVIDVALLGLQSIFVCRLVQEEFPRSRVIVWSDEEAIKHHFKRLKEAGVKAYCLRSRSAYEIILAIDKLKRNASFVSEPLEGDLLV